ncbi:hypothetical protein JHK87_015819 [Glycine soja]|nr:hypothetical protein JHK87_015819 [Glycine soja]
MEDTAHISGSQVGKIFQDLPIWQPSDSGTLSFRQAFDFLYDFANKVGLMSRSSR